MRPSLARYNNLDSSKIRADLHSTKAFLEFIKEYGNIGATEAVLEELAVKNDLLNSVVNSYAGTRNRSRQRCQTTVTSALRKQKDEDTLSIVEDLVINAQSNKIKRKNYNDERIVSYAINRAFLNDEFVAIITKDFRFKSILTQTQRSVDSENRFLQLREFLQEGKVIVIFGEKDKFYVRYCSGDFDKNYQRFQYSKY
ncbi:hypothetical protein J4416_04550 [Candidatus Pacearchaeota archaeon]|nr:hypothetical protein [Candidatus Pacearchaeota archaeon]